MWRADAKACLSALLLAVGSAAVRDGVLEDKKHAAAFKRYRHYQDPKNLTGDPQRSASSLSSLHDKASVVLDSRALGHRFHYGHDEGDGKDKGIGTSVVMQKAVQVVATSEDPGLAQKSSPKDAAIEQGSQESKSPATVGGAGLVSTTASPKEENADLSHGPPTPAPTAIDNKADAKKPHGKSGNIFHTFGVIAGVFIVFYVIIQCCGRRAQDAKPDTSEPLEQQHDNVIEEDPKLTELRAQRMKLLMNQAVAKEKYEALVREITSLEAESKGEELNDAELTAKVEDAMQGAELATHQGMISAIAYATPLLTQSERVYTTFQENVTRAQEKAKSVVAEESKQAFAEIAQSMTASASHLDTKVIDDVLRDARPPKLAILIASAVAPAQLRSIHFSNKSRIVVMLMYVFVDLVVILDKNDLTCWSELPPETANTTFSVKGFVNERYLSAQMNLVLGWTMIDFSVLAFTCLVRFNAHLSMLPIMEHIDAPPPVNIANDSMTALRLLIDYFLTTGAKALFELDHIANSHIFQLSGWTTVFSFMWMAYAVTLVYNTPWAECANLSLVMLRFRVTIYLVCLVPAVLEVVFFLIGRVFQSEKFAITLLRIADSIDEAAQIGLPVAKVLVYSFMFRSVEDMIDVEIKIKRTENQKLVSEKETLEQQLSEKATVVEAHEAELRALEEQRASYGEDEEMNERVEKMKSEAMANSKQFLQQMQDSAMVATNQAIQDAAAMSAGAAAKLQADGLPSGDLARQVLDQAATGQALMNQAQQALHQAEEAAEQYTQTVDAHLPASVHTALGQNIAGGSVTAENVPPDAVTFSSPSNPPPAASGETVDAEGELPSGPRTSMQAGKAKAKMRGRRSQLEEGTLQPGIENHPQVPASPGTSPTTPNDAGV